MNKKLKLSLVTTVGITSLLLFDPSIGHADTSDSSYVDTNQSGYKNKRKIKKGRKKANLFKSFNESNKDCTTNNSTNDTDVTNEAGTSDGSTESINNNNSGDISALTDVDKSGYDPYYTNVKKSDAGIIVMGSENVSSSTLDIAGSIIDKMLSKKGTGIAEKMAENNAKLAVFGKGENVFSIPEHKQFYSENLLYAEGLGGTMSIPVTSITESNVLRLMSGDYVTNYKNENILVHEFAHAIQLIGVDQLEDKSLYNEFNAAYANAKANNLFPNTYAISNREEFFATTTQMWFNVMNESSDGSWDGTRGPVNTREELKAYDRTTYDFLAKIYPENDFLSNAWSGGIEDKFSAK